MKRDRDKSSPTTSISDDYYLYNIIYYKKAESRFNDLRP